MEKIRITAENEGGLPIEGFLNFGVGKWTGLIMDNGTIIPVKKDTVKLKKEETIEKTDVSV